MLAHAQNLVYTLKELMPTQYQKDNLEAMLTLFLEAQGHPLPEHSQTLSGGVSVDGRLKDGSKPQSIVLVCIALGKELCWVCIAG